MSAVRKVTYLGCVRSGIREVASGGVFGVVSGATGGYEWVSVGLVSSRLRISDVCLGGVPEGPRGEGTPVPVGAQGNGAGTTWGSDVAGGIRGSLSGSTGV